jgi:CRP/FNR family cyclic AMP-dependent transcriptional regulator
LAGFELAGIWPDYRFPLENSSMTPPETPSSSCPLFQDMSLDERQEVLARLIHESFPAGETILREGRSTQMLWIIVRGRCEVAKMMHDETEQRLAILESGAVFGEMSFFNPAPHSASVRALNEVEVMQLSREHYDELERICPSGACKVMLNTVKVLSERLRRMDDWTADFVQRSDAPRHYEEWRDFRAKLYSDWQF